MVDIVLLMGDFLSLRENLVRRSAHQAICLTALYHSLSSRICPWVETTT